MRLAVRKIQVEDAAKLQTLVVENLDGIEPGLAVLDARLLLGHSTIDVVALDAAGTLVLIAVGLTANEEMILKAVEAYSWTLEYPQALQRLYPGCVLSEERPPRLLFAVERMSDAFQRKIKQLGFPEVDCVEVRHVEVDGVPTVYFESLSRIRKLAAPTVVERVPQATVPAPELTRGPVGSGENVIVMNGNGTARAVAPRLPKPTQTEASLNGIRASDRPTPSRELGAVVSMINRQTAAVAPDLPRPVIEPVVLRPQETVAPVPVAAEPKLAEPIVTKPSVTEAVVTTPVVIEPSTPEPVVTKPLAVELSVPEPVVKPLVAEAERARVGRREAAGRPSERARAGRREPRGGRAERAGDRAGGDQAAGRRDSRGEADRRRGQAGGRPHDRADGRTPDDDDPDDRPDRSGSGAHAAAAAGQAGRDQRALAGRAPAAGDPA